MKPWGERSFGVGGSEYVGEMLRGSGDVANVMWVIRVCGEGYGSV